MSKNKNPYNQPLLSIDTQFELVSESQKKTNIIDMSPDIDPNNNIKLAYNLTPLNTEIIDNNNDITRRQPQFINHSEQKEPSNDSKYTIADETETDEITDSSNSNQMQRRSERSSTSAMYTEYGINDNDDNQRHFHVDMQQNLIQNGRDIAQQKLSQHIIPPTNTPNFNPNLRASATPSQHNLQPQHPIYNNNGSTSNPTHTNSIYTDTGQSDQDNDTLGIIYNIIRKFAIFFIIFFVFRICNNRGTNTKMWMVCLDYFVYLLSDTLSICIDMVLYNNMYSTKMLFHIYNVFEYNLDLDR